MFIIIQSEELKILKPNQLGNITKKAFQVLYNFCFLKDILNHRFFYKLLKGYKILMEIRLSIEELAQSAFRKCRDGHDNPPKPHKDYTGLLIVGGNEEDKRTLKRRFLELCEDKYLVKMRPVSEGEINGFYSIDLSQISELTP